MSITYGLESRCARIKASGPIDIVAPLEHMVNYRQADKCLPWQLPDGYTVYDVDGVLIDINHRLELYKKDPKLFHTEYEKDKPTNFFNVFKKQILGAPSLVLTFRSDLVEVYKFFERHAISTHNLCLISVAETTGAEGLPSDQFKVGVLHLLKTAFGISPGIFYEDSIRNIKAVQRAFPSCSVVRVHDVLRDEDILTY